MILEEIRDKIILSLSETFSGYEVYGDVARQNFEYPAITVKVNSGTIKRDGAGRHRISVDYSICVFENESSNKFNVLNKVSSALFKSKTGAVLTDLSFSKNDKFMEFNASFITRAMLSEDPAEKMEELTEEVRLNG